VNRLIAVWLDLDRAELHELKVLAARRRVTLARLLADMLRRQYVLETAPQAAEVRKE